MGVFFCIHMLKNLRLPNLKVSAVYFIHAYMYAHTAEIPLLILIIVIKGSHTSKSCIKLYLQV